LPGAHPVRSAHELGRIHSKAAIEQELAWRLRNNHIVLLTQITHHIIQSMAIGECPIGSFGGNLRVPCRNLRIPCLRPSRNHPDALDLAGSETVLAREFSIAGALCDARHQRPRLFRGDWQPIFGSCIIGRRRGDLR
jgi:hypothetical protein